MKKIIYLLLFGLVGIFQQANAQENKSETTNRTATGVSVKINDNSSKVEIVNLKDGKINDEKQPLVIVNDSVIDYSLLNVLDPNKIKSVEVIKDAASTLRYGDPARNGVIIITTKDYVPKPTIK